MKLVSGLKELLQKSYQLQFMTNALMILNLSQYNFQACVKLVIKMSVITSILIFLMGIKVTQLHLVRGIILELTDLVCRRVNFRSLTNNLFASGVTLLSHITQWLKDALMNKNARTKTNVVLKPTWKKLLSNRG